MRNSLYKQAIAAASTLLLSLFLLPACSDESGTGTPDIPETKYAKLTITLGSLDNAMPGTRAAEDNNIIDDNFADEVYERHIDDWYIIVVNKGVVDRVVSNNPEVQNREESNVRGGTDDDSNTEIGINLIVDESYSFYALANLKGLKNYSDVIASLGNLKRQNFTDAFRKTAAELKALDSYTGKEGASYIPMSSYVGTAKVYEDITKNVVSLQLIRLLGKVSIEVTNATGVDITVNELAMGKFRQSGNIYLLPYDAAYQGKDPDKGKENLLLGKGTGAEYELMDPKFPGDPIGVGTDWIYTPLQGADDQVIKKADAVDEEANKQKYMFYINETDQASVGANGADMKIALEVTGDGIEKDNTPKPTNFFFIRRNDLLKIPVLISNAETTISFEQQHMPIGGLPTKYTFNAGVDVPIRLYITDHAGKITISYSLEEMNGETTGWELKYFNKNVEGKDYFSYAELVENSTAKEYVPFVLKPENTEDLSKWWSQSAFKHQDQPKWGYVLNHEEATPTQGSFTINVQELGNAASAEIKLVLVAVKGDTQVPLPYTLIIKNNGKQKEEGGNL